MSEEKEQTVGVNKSFDGGLIVSVDRRPTREEISANIIVDLARFVDDCHLTPHRWALDRRKYVEKKVAEQLATLDSRARGKPMIDQALVDFAISFLAANLDEEVEEMLVSAGVKALDVIAAANQIDRRTK
jgi:hypothetical protein